MATQRIVIEVPDQVLLAEKTDAARFGQEMRLLSAIKLYELGRLTSGSAADLAGMPRLQFLQVLGRYQVFPLEAELMDLEQGHG